MQRSCIKHCHGQAARASQSFNNETNDRRPVGGNAFQNRGLVQSRDCPVVSGMDQMALSTCSNVKGGKGHLLALRRRKPIAITVSPISLLLAFQNSAHWKALCSIRSNGPVTAPACQTPSSTSGVGETTPFVHRNRGRPCCLSASNTHCLKDAALFLLSMTAARCCNFSANTDKWATATTSMLHTFLNSSCTHCQLGKSSNKPHG